MELILQLVVSVITCAVVTYLYWHRKASGKLYIDHTNPEKDIYRIAINDLDKLSKKKRIVLYVDNNAHLSQE